MARSSDCVPQDVKKFRPAEDGFGILLTGDHVQCCVLLKKVSQSQPLYLPLQRNTSLFSK